jgi:hypothetical protein
MFFILLSLQPQTKRPSVLSSLLKCGKLQLNHFLEENESLQFARRRRRLWFRLVWAQGREAPNFGALFEFSDEVNNSHDQESDDTNHYNSKEYEHYQRHLIVFLKEKVNLNFKVSEKNLTLTGVPWKLGKANVHLAG